MKIEEGETGVRKGADGLSLLLVASGWNREGAGPRVLAEETSSLLTVRRSEAPTETPA